VIPSFIPQGTPLNTELTLKRFFSCFLFGADLPDLLFVIWLSSWFEFVAALNLSGRRSPGGHGRAKVAIYGNRGIEEPPPS
jgi:hypothetical protein